MPDEVNSEPPDGQMLIYQGSGMNLRVRLDGQTVWLTQRLIAELFQVSIKTANEHLINIYGDDELDPTATIRKFRIVQTEGARQVSRLVDHYNLDAIRAVISCYRASIFSRTARLNHAGIRSVLSSSTLPSVTSASHVCFRSLLSPELSNTYARLVCRMASNSNSRER